MDLKTAYSPNSAVPFPSHPEAAAFQIVPTGGEEESREGADEREKRKWERS